MELRHLRYFVILSEELHYGRAAERLHMTQPPLSRSIVELEEKIGVLLFNRTKRRVSLTEAGKVFLTHALQILNQVEKAYTTTRLVHNGEMGQITVGFAGGTTNILMQLQKAFTSQYPQAEFILRRLGTADQVIALKEQKIHIGLLYPPVDSSKLTLLTMTKQRMLVALPSDHPLAEETGPIDLTALEHESFIVPPRIAGPSYHDVLIHMCYQAGFVPKVVLEVYELETIVSLVSEGLGLSFVPTMFRSYQVKGVVYKEIAEAAPLLETSIVWRTDETSGIARTFIDFVKKWDWSDLIGAT